MDLLDGFEITAERNDDIILSRGIYLIDAFVIRDFRSYRLFYW